MPRWHQQQHTHGAACTDSGDPGPAQHTLAVCRAAWLQVTQHHAGLARLALHDSEGARRMHARCQRACMRAHAEGQTDMEQRGAPCDTRTMTHLQQVAMHRNGPPHTSLKARAELLRLRKWDLEREGARRGLREGTGRDGVGGWVGSGGQGLACVRMGCGGTGRTRTNICPRNAPLIHTSRWALPLQPPVSDTAWPAGRGGCSPEQPPTPGAAAEGDSSPAGDWVARGFLLRRRRCRPALPQCQRSSGAQRIWQQHLPPCPPGPCTRAPPQGRQQRCAGAS